MMRKVDQRDVVLCFLTKSRMQRKLSESWTRLSLMTELCLSDWIEISEKNLE
jgi:hypothetical protein